ncbi:MAG: hypothetical protein KC464_23275, partial [Myxococcales bacterium]|nr:hypothetical protein [Myxococcales bacterium]
SSPLFADDAMLDRVDRATHYEGVTETWAWHDAMRTSMSTMHRRRPVLDGYIQVKTPWGTARMPHYAQDGYADEELDYLHGLQQRLADKVRELLSIQAPPCAKPEVGSPLDQFFWAVDPPYDADAGLFGPYDALGRGAPMSQTDPRYNLLAVGTPVMFDLGGTVSYATPTCNQQIASTGRGAALLEEIGALLTEADTWGCLDSGTTPCDWSPRGFYFATTGGFAEATESTYQTCLQSVPTSTDLSGIADVAWRVPLAPINNCPLLRDGSYDRACRDITRIGDDYSADGHGYTSSTTDLERYFDDAATFRAKLAEFAKAAAERHVRELPGAPLVNPATGKLRPPGHSFSGGDTLGNNYFGLTYAYGTTYSNPGGYAGCSTSSRFASDASTDVRIFDKDFPLLGVHAEAAPAGDSVTVKILGNEVPAEDLVPGAPMNFATPTLSEGASFWFTVLGVPIKVELGLAGQAGVTVAQQATTSCSSGRPTFDVAAQVTPWFGVDGFATAAVDALVVRAGVKGQIAILHGALPFVAGAEVHAKPDAPTEDVFHARAEIGLELSTLSGRIAAFAELGVCPFCTGAEGTIISWQGPAWNEPLASYDYAISLADLDLVFDSH